MNHYERFANHEEKGCGMLIKELIRSVTVTWPDGRETSVYNLRSAPLGALLAIWDPFQ